MATKPKHAKGERWGKERIDNRDWQKYTEELVVRGEFLLELKWVNGWDEEVDLMNEGKRGAPFVFPHSLIALQAVWNQWVGVRGVEGITRKLVEFAQVPEFNDYSTIYRRVRRIEPCFELPKQGFCSVSTDATGMKMHHAGEYRTSKYGGKQRRWIRVTLSANPLTKNLLALDVSLDSEGDSESVVAMQHLNHLWNHEKIVDKFWGDGAYDVHELFNLLEQHHTESSVPPRDNASTESRGSMRRSREVHEYKSKCWTDWTRDKSHGKRWSGTEGIFSAVKGIFGEHTRAKEPEFACREAARKFWLYETIKQYAKAQV